MGHMVIEQKLTINSTNVPNDTLTEWKNRTGAVTSGDQVQVNFESDGTTARFPGEIYEAISDGVTGYPPTNPNEWLFVGAINRHRMFDGRNNSRTVADSGEGITVSVTPEGRCKFVYLIGLRNVRKVDVSVNSTDNFSADLLISYTAIGWYSWLFDIKTIDRAYRRSAGFYIVTGVTPPYQPTVTITLHSADKPAECGQVVVGTGFYLGDTEWGVEPALRDYSTYEADVFGNRTLVPRQTTRNVGGTLWVPTNDYDRVYQIFESRMNSLALYDFNNGDDISASDVKDSLRVYGKLTSVSGGLQYGKTPINLQIEGND